MDPYWTPQMNDLIGGWIVTNYPHPLAEHNLQDRSQYVIADCNDRSEARLIADLLNREGYTR